MFQLKKMGPWLVWLRGLRALACEPKSRWFDSQSTARAWVAGQVPSMGHMRGNRTLVFLSSFSLPSPL